MKERFRVFTVFALLALVAAAPPAAALSSRAAAKDSASLDALKASDAEITNALVELDAQVAQQKIALLTAQQAVDAASQTVAYDDAALEAAQKHLAELTAIAASRAIDEYVQPHGDAISSMLGADGFTEASRRSSLLQEVAGHDRQTIENLKAARVDLNRERRAALEAHQVADARRVVEQSKLDQLNAARAEKARLDESLQQRLESYAAEDAAGAGATSGDNSARASRSGPTQGDDGRVSAAGMKWPVAGPVRSPFGPRWGTTHTGIDIGGAEGTPIYAAKDGTVTSAEFDGGGYGNLVKIDNRNGLETFYAHQSRINVKVGAEVKQGDLIGWVGHTGRVVPNNAGAAHLHFETRINGAPRDPAQYLP